MKHFFSYFLTFYLLLFTFYLPAQAAANNRFGVHILFPEEVKEAAELVNSSGGEWGYVVIPIQSKDKNREKWQSFMDNCRENKLIPIIRLATYAENWYWTKPTEFDSVDFANFLADLDWPTAQKIVAVYNEPNHSKEWGGEVNPAEYANVLVDTIDEFKRRDDKFLMLNAGLDASAPSAGQNSLETMDEYEFMSQMMMEETDIFRKIDGFNSHAYGNPGFAANPNVDSRYNVGSFEHELSFLQNYYGIYGLKVYITEGGWSRNAFLGDEKIGQFYKIAYSEIWNQDFVVAAAPFILKADGSAFENFGLIWQGKKTKSFELIAALPKIKGRPELTKQTYLAQNKIKDSEMREYQPRIKTEKSVNDRWWNKLFRQFIK